MSKKIDFIKLAGKAKECNIVFKINDLGFIDYYSEGVVYCTDTEPVSDARLLFANCTADYVARKLIELGEALKEEMA
ncbi:hypothetical protein AAY81_04915 [Denitrobacterium detoxificans]|uniref:Uncharacterized protein n=1 Tax=Denitrobacterium detoxificans TaxID=79604 RepID=A0A172RY18_9ACTN|nr:hypothetical protein [Denitrobacterium detoxificans]ANE22574.1 hypothetical protein AAY81_04915 [Denitrobacterium detoxificans]SEP04033.1 hypothetical protein SAMN02910314_01998 [Denitrobacterium detoxificans]